MIRLTELLIIAFGVSVDAFAVSAGGALCPASLSRRACALRAGLFFGGFQFLMPAIGYFAASLMSNTVHQIDHWLAFALLLLVGGKMIWEAFAEETEKDHCPMPGKGEFFAVKNLFVPAVATSLDALAVGAGLAFAGRDLWLPAISMGVVTGLVSALGVYLGNKLRSVGQSKYLAIAGGAAIILVGVKILLDDLIF